MPELHVCTCDGSELVGAPAGCAAVPFRDVCRFEQALADPTEAQITAGVEALNVVLGPPDDPIARRSTVEAVLAAAAVVVLGRPPCTSCGRPLGTGTLLDHSPSPNHLGVTVETLRWGTADRTGRMPVEPWEAFAARYRCPACAEHERRSAAALGYVTELIEEHRKGDTDG